MMRVLTPATSANLGPGFDCLGLSLQFFNEVQIEKAKFFSISVQGEGADNVFVKKNNAFVNIFNEIYTKLSDKKEIFRFIFHNKIPFSRGLGSSSAVIVGAIASAYAMSGVKISREEILNLALKYESHPDNIAPAALGGFVCSVVERGQVFSIKKEIDTNLKAVIVIPNVAMNTNKSRNLLPKTYSIKDCVFNLSHSSFLTACFLEKKYDLLRRASLDRMHQYKRMKLLPELFTVQKTALENGALMSTLSGSGSSFFNMICKDDASHLSAILQKKFPQFRIEILDFDNKGFEIC